MFNTNDVLLNDLYYFIDGIKGRLSEEELNALTDIYNALVLKEEDSSEMVVQLDLFETKELELIEHIQDTINEVGNIINYSEHEGDELLVEILEVINRDLEVSGELSNDLYTSELKKIINNFEKSYDQVKEVTVDNDDSIDIDNEEINNVSDKDYFNTDINSSDITLIHTRLGEKYLLKEGSLIQNKKGKMFVIDKVIRYQYSGEIKIKIEFYPVSDNGLIDESKIKKCAVSDVGLKFDGVVKYKMLDWTFNNESHEDKFFENVNEEPAHEKEIEPLLNNDSKKDIKLNYYTESNYYYPIKFKYEGRDFDGIKIKEHKGKSVEVSAMKGNIPYCTIKKRINIDLDEKVFYLSFGDYTVDIGNVEYS